MECVLFPGTMRHGHTAQYGERWRHYLHCTGYRANQRPGSNDHRNLSF